MCIRDRWLLRNADLPESTVFGTIDSWLLFKLTGRHATDYTNASRTMLFDIRRLAWDEELCAMLGVDPARLPQPRGIDAEHRAELLVPGEPADVEQHRPRGVGVVGRVAAGQLEEQPGVDRAED